MSSRSPRWTWRAVAERMGGPKAVPLGQGRFRFFGYGPRRQQALLSDFDYIADRRPPLLELRNVLFLPDQRCLFGETGLRIEPSRVTYVEPDAPPWFNAEKYGVIERATMPERLEPPSGAMRVRDPVLFLGEIHDHYGHFITDVMSRMWALEHTPPDLKVLFAPDPGVRLKTPLVREFLDALGLAGRLLRPAGPVLFETLYCPVAALQLSRIYQCFESAPRRAAQALLPRAAERPAGPVYLTRSRLRKGLRRLHGEEELQDRLEREGFRVISPERLDLPRQMALFNGGHPVVGPFGSAMHSVLFRTSGHGQPLATLFAGKVPPRFMMVDAVKGSDAAYIRCIRFDGEPEAGGRGWVLDVEAAMARLDAAGLLGGKGGRA